MARLRAVLAGSAAVVALGGGAYAIAGAPGERLEEESARIAAAAAARDASFAPGRATEVVLADPAVPALPALRETGSIPEMRLRPRRRGVGAPRRAPAPVRTAAPRAPAEDPPAPSGGDGAGDPIPAPAPPPAPPPQPQPAPAPAPDPQPARDPAPRSDEPTGEAFDDSG